MSTLKIFFSYSRHDSAFALRLAKDIRSSGVDIWIDQLDINPGLHWDAAVEKALMSSICVLVILSPSSTSSTNVMDEVSFALESGKKIIPVLLEECLPPFRLRRLQRIDFTKDYNEGLTQLLASFNSTGDLGSKGMETKEENDKRNQGIDDNTSRAKDSAEVEARLWNDACKLNTIVGYEKYLKETKTKEYEEEAKLNINQLVKEQKEDELEAKAWKEAKTENTAAAYNKYLKAYPSRNYNTLALHALAEIEAKQKEEQKKLEEKRLEEKRLEEKRQEEKRQEARLLEEKKKEEKRLEALALEEKRKEEKRLEDKKKEEKRLEDKRQEEIRREEKKQENILREEKKQEQKKAAALVAANSNTENTVNVNPTKWRNILIGSFIVISGLIIWLLTGLHPKSGKDQKAWEMAIDHRDSISFAAYLAQFPKGKYAKLANSKIDSIHVHRQAIRDSTTLAQSQIAQVVPTVKDTVKTTPTQVPADKPVKVTTPATKPKPAVTPPKPASQFKIGQAYRGGVIIYIDQTGQHGLIAADKDLSAQGYESAMKKSANFKAGDYHDWRLPNKDELSRLYAMRKELGLLTKGAYWSGTPDKGGNAWALNMNDGKHGSFSKTMSYYVRPVRVF